MLSLFRKGLGQKPGLNRNSVYLEFLLAINILEFFRSATGGGSACIQFWVVFIRFSPSLFFQQILPPLHPRPPFFLKKNKSFLPFCSQSESPAKDQSQQSDTYKGGSARCIVLTEFCYWTAILLFKESLIV